MLNPPMCKNCRNLLIKIPAPESPNILDRILNLPNKIKNLIRIGLGAGFLAVLGSTVFLQSQALSSLLGINLMPFQWTTAVLALAATAGGFVLLGRKSTQKMELTKNSRLI